MLKKKSQYFSILLFGTLLAILAGGLKLMEYRYLIGSLNTDIYTTVVATIFTAIGIWIGISLLKPTPKAVEQSSTPSKPPSNIKALNLNKREYEILQLIAQGFSNQEIANQLFIALPTVKTHTSKLYSKLEVKSRTQAVHKAQKLGLIE